MTPHSALILLAVSRRIPKGFSGGGRTTELVNGCGRKGRTGEKVPSPSRCPFSSEHPLKLRSAHSTPRTLCLFSRIRRTFSPIYNTLSAFRNTGRPLDALLSSAVSRNPPDTFPCLLNLQLPAV